MCFFGRPAQVKFVSSRNGLLSGTGAATASVWVRQLVQASSLSDPNLFQKGTVKRIRKRSDSENMEKRAPFCLFFLESSQDSSGKPVVKEDANVFQVKKDQDRFKETF